MNPRRAIIICVIMIGLFSSRAFALEEKPVGVLSAAPGSIREEPFVRGSELGSAVADAVRAFAGTDAALVNAGDLANDLNAGEITRADVESVFAEDRTLAAAELTQAELWALLEHAVSQVTLDPKTDQLKSEKSRFDGFCQVSGLRFTYDASAPAGERILEITREDGAELGDTVTVCASAYMLGGGYGFEPAEYTLLDGTLADALEAYIRGNTSFPDTGDGRITVIGINTSIVGTLISRWELFAGCLFLIGCLAFYGMRMKNYQEEYGKTEKESDVESMTRAMFRTGGRR